MVAFWFQAASIVTSWNAVGGAELDDFNLFLSEDAKDFIKEGNKFLFGFNMKNFQDLYTDGRLDITFTAAQLRNGLKTQFDVGKLNGKELDFTSMQCLTP